MYYVRRDKDGKIELMTSHPYEDENGSLNEVLPKDHPDVVEFLRNMNEL